MQYKQEFINTIIVRLNILHKLWDNQVSYQKNAQQQKLLLFSKKAGQYRKRKKLLKSRLLKRSRTIQQLAKNQLINTMRITHLY